MSECSAGEVLGTATVLPATSALTIFLANRVHPFILTGFIIINLLALTILLAKIARYLANRR